MAKGDKMARETLQDIRLGDCRGDMYRFEATRLNGRRVVREITYETNDAGNRVKKTDTGWREPSAPVIAPEAPLPPDVAAIVAETESDVAE